MKSEKIMSAIEELRQVFGKDRLQEVCWFAYI